MKQICEASPLSISAIMSGLDSSTDALLAILNLKSSVEGSQMSGREPFASFAAPGHRSRWMANCADTDIVLALLRAKDKRGPWPVRRDARAGPSARQPTRGQSNRLSSSSRR